MRRASVESVKAWRARTAKPLRPRSLKMQREYVKRRAFVAKYLAEHTRCEFDPCRADSVDVHEVIRRSHGGALYPGQAGKRPTPYAALCRHHHTWVTEHPALARAYGWEVK